MRSSFIILFTFISLTAFGQQDGQISYDTLGFANKAEITNQYINGFKEGKWVDYFNHSDGWMYQRDSTRAAMCVVHVYKKGEDCGITRIYYKDPITEIYSAHPDTNPVERHYENGSLINETTFNNRTKNWVTKSYFLSAKLKTECSWLMDEPIMCKEYYEDGSLKQETTFTDKGRKWVEKNYDKSGKEIKQ